MRSSNLRFQGFYTKNLVLTRQVYRCIKLQSVNLFVCYIKENKVEEEFLFCKPLSRTTNTKKIFKLIKEFFNKHNLDLKMIGSICTDGALAMLGNCSGFAAMLKKEIPELKVTHCLLHRQALAFKTLPQYLKGVLNSCVKS